MVIVSVKRKSESAVKDIEVSPDLPVEQLSSIIAKAMNWDQDDNGSPIVYDIEAHPPGRVLGKNETLAQVNAWDGSWLILLPRKENIDFMKANAQPEPAQDKNSQDQIPASPNSKYVWKRVDENHD